MNTFAIIYEFSNPGLEFLYTNLINQIKSYTYWARPVKNMWLIKTTATKDEVIHSLRSKLVSGDKLLVISVNSEWISINLDQNVVKWMQNSL